MPPSTESGTPPSPPKDSKAETNAKDEPLMVVSPLVTDLVPAKDASGKAESSTGNESQKALTIAELIALTDLLNDSAVSDFSSFLISFSDLAQVEREKLELAALQEVIGTLENEIELELNKFQDKDDEKKDSSKPANPGQLHSCSPPRMCLNFICFSPLDESSESDVDSDDPSIQRLRSVLKGMMKKLEVRVKQTEDQLGKKLQQLDKDRDGILDSNELREAVMKILKKKDVSAAESQNLIQLLDQDNDGKGMDESFCCSLRS